MTSSLPTHSTSLAAGRAGCYWGSLSMDRRHPRVVRSGRPQDSGATAAHASLQCHRAMLGPGQAAGKAGRTTDSSCSQARDDSRLSGHASGCHCELHCRSQVQYPRWMKTVNRSIYQLKALDVSSHLLVLPSSNSPWRWRYGVGNMWVTSIVRHESPVSAILVDRHLRTSTVADYLPIDCCKGLIDDDDLLSVIAACT
jgi:hypothetical protein